MCMENEVGDAGCYACLVICRSLANSARDLAGHMGEFGLCEAKANAEALYTALAEFCEERGARCMEVITAGAALILNGWVTMTEGRGKND